jgi:hypothetical protein
MEAIEKFFHDGLTSKQSDLSEQYKKFNINDVNSHIMPNDITNITKELENIKIENLDEDQLRALAYILRQPENFNGFENKANASLINKYLISKSKKLNEAVSKYLHETPIKGGSRKNRKTKSRSKSRTKSKKRSKSKKHH